MKCLNCGVSADHYLCGCCQTPDILDKIFKEIRFYKPETCENPYLSEIASGLTESMPSEILSRQFSICLISRFPSFTIASITGCAEMFGLRMLPLRI